jgi:hypothetical protein
MLRKLNLQGVESDAGFKVQVVSRGGIEYSIGTRRLLVGFEPGISSDGSPNIAVYASKATSWEAPYDKEPIDEVTRSSIVRDIRDALDFLGTSYEVV